MSIRLELATRAQRWAELSRAEDWPSLFAMADAVLSNRDVLGDDPRESAGAHAIWLRSAFIVAASPLVELGRAGEGMVAVCSGQALEAASFDAAKWLAECLLAPMGPGGLEQASQAAKSGLVERMAELKAHARSLPESEWSMMPTPKGDEFNLLVGTACWSSLDHPRGALDLNRPADGVLQTVEPEWARALGAAECRLAWDELLESGDFAYVACGPQGGVWQAASECRKIAAAARKFKRELSSHGFGEVGLGGLGVYANASPVGDRADAAFEPWRFDLVFKAPFRNSSLHHEWTHALDKMCRAVGSRRARADASALMEGLSFVERDQRVFDEELMEARLGAKSAWAALVGEIAVHAGGERAALPLARIAWQSASRGLCDSLELRARARLADMGAEQRALCLAGMERGAWAARPAVAKWRSLEASSKSSTTSFKAVADSLDAACLSDCAGYFSNPAEMLARAGEGRFAGLLGDGDSLPNGRLVFGEKVATEHPRGAEREKISALFDRWLGSCAPMAEHALSQRRAHVARPASKDRLVEMGRLAQKMVANMEQEARTGLRLPAMQTQEQLGSMPAMGSRIGGQSQAAGSCGVNGRLGGWLP